MRCPTVLFAALLALAPRVEAEIVGKARVIDGGTLEVGGRSVRLFAIDAPAEDQDCTVSGRPWHCGREAAFALADFVGRHWVTCAERGSDHEGRVIAVCRVGERDLSRTMVAGGWALADRRFSTDYIAAEQDAMAARRGAWRGDLVPPEESGWRITTGASPPSPSGYEVCVRGEAEAGGVECPAFRGADGRLYTLLGSAVALKPGTAACLCGAVAEMSFCMRGIALAVAWIGRPEECPATREGAAGVAD